MTRYYHAYTRQVSTRNVRTPVTVQYRHPAVCMDSSTIEFISPRGRGSYIKCSVGSSSTEARGWACGSALAVAAIKRLSLQISNARHRAQLVQLVITALLAGQLAHLAVGVIDPAKHDGVRRAGLCAGGNHLTIANIALFRLCAVLPGMDALQAERALLHHAAPPHGHIRIELVLQAGQIRVNARISVITPVEHADLVGAVVRTVARADAAVVDLQVRVLRGAVY